MTRAWDWIREHDDRLSFVVLYIGGAIALSIWLNLFWVAMLMLAHFGLEVVRGRLLGAERPLLHALWEVKLDIALVLFALVVALYSDYVLGLLGLGQAARAGQAVRGVQAAARFGVVERALRIVVLTSDDLLRLVQAVLKFRSKAASDASPVAEHAAAATAQAPEAGLSAGDIASLSFGALCLALILLAPNVLGASPEEIGSRLMHEISPAR